MNRDSSRALLWAQFASGALAVNEHIGLTREVQAAGVADGLLQQFEQRFTWFDAGKHPTDNRAGWYPTTAREL